jgi:hypothetical protein
MNKWVEPPRSAEQLVELGAKPSKAAINLQSDLVDVFAQSGRAWVSRAHNELELWSQLASNIVACRSVPQALGAYQESLSRRMQMAMDDGLRFVEDYQGIVAKFAHSFSGSWTGSTGTDSPRPTKRRS